MGLCYPSDTRVYLVVGFSIVVSNSHARVWNAYCFKVYLGDCIDVGIYNSIMCNLCELIIFSTSPSTPITRHHCHILYNTLTKYIKRP